jgi:Fe/S biogenesis protein NfuA
MVSWFRRKEQRGPDVQVDAQPSPHVTFTPAAHEQLAAVLGRQAEPAALRILVKNPGAEPPQYDMALEPASVTRPGDTVMDADGLRIVVDALSLPFVAGATVRFSDDPLQPGFLVEAAHAHAHGHGHVHGEGASAEIPSEFDASNPLAIQVESVLQHHINPSIASHGGHAQLVGVKDDVVYVALGGGCQGCSMASVTLKQGIEQILKQAIPKIRAVIDATDHALGSNPFYGADKGGESPFHEPAKA